MYDELEPKSRPTQRLHRTHKQCQSGGSASLGEELNRLNWFNLIKWQTAVSVKWNFFLQPELHLCVCIVYFFHEVSALFNKFYHI